MKDWFAQSNADMRSTSGIYLAVLQNDVPSPIARESDEEKPAPRARSRRRRPRSRRPRRRRPKTSPRLRSRPTSRAQKPFRIDFEGLEYRILDLPIPPATLSNLQVGAAGQVYYLKTWTAPRSLNRYDLNTRKNDVVLPSRRRDYVVSADAKKLLYRSGQNWSIVPTNRAIQPAEGRHRGRRHRGPHRPAARVEADLRRGVADQPRLLLRPEHARRGLAEAEGEVRGVPAARHDARAT